MHTVQPTPGTKPASLPPMLGSEFIEIAHDARSLVTAMGLYCDLLAEPGVLAECHRHYVDELRLVTAATRRLTEKLGTMTAGQSKGVPAKSLRTGRAIARGMESVPAAPIQSLSRELRSLRNLLASVAGAGISLELDCETGEIPVELTIEDLIRILVNLVRNAAEAMPEGGTIAILLREQKGPHAGAVLVVEDNGPGIPEGRREEIFLPRFTTKAGGCGEGGAHRGLGLSITRSIVEAAGGRISAAERQGGGARFEMELPVLRR